MPKYNELPMTHITLLMEAFHILYMDNQKLFDR